MPRPKKPGAPEPKRRSRNGCWPCKNRKIKCGEERPSCVNCQRSAEACDYSIRLNWEGRRGKKPEAGIINFGTDAPPSALPARGFKLVHQNPNSDSSSSRRLEPLVDPPSRPRVDTAKAVSLSTTSALELSATSPDGIDGFQRPTKRRNTGNSELEATDTLEKRRRTSKGAAQYNELPERRPHSSHSSVVESGPSTQRFANSNNTSSTASPLTPATSAFSDDDPRAMGLVDPSASTTSPDPRRLSMNSMVSSAHSSRRWSDDSPMISHPDNANKTYYGIDRGFTDYDLGKNDDQNAINGASPLLHRATLDTPVEEQDSDDLFPQEFGFGVQTYDVDEELGGYYAKPVHIYIPRNLEPLPPKLRENPMNILYFHHFLNHTAKVLVPYDDPHANPFRTILPQLAIKNDNLLALMLAYSALHRSRLLSHPEPTLRIATWVVDVFPALREALSDPGKNFSDANLATAIMLTSLEIISPRAFGYDIPWQRHLGLARELITSRPGGLRGMRTNFRHDQTCSFLWSWAAYLDVIGSLSGNRKGSSTAWIFQYEYDDLEDGYDEIDCIMGFTTGCIYLLAKVADLAAKCDAERIQDDHTINSDWQPSEDVQDQAMQLLAGIKNSMQRDPVPCKHIHSRGDVAKWDKGSLSATNEAFHWAALVQLHRRIMGLPSEDEKVQEAVQGIISCLQSIRPGGTAEACLLFPIFTAGCDSHTEEQRNLVLQRLGVAGDHGMTYVQNARTLMEKVWETNMPWETLVSTEFIG